MVKTTPIRFSHSAPTNPSCESVTPPLRSSRRKSSAIVLRAYRKITITEGTNTTTNWAEQESTTNGTSEGLAVTVGQSIAAGTSESDGTTRTHQGHRGVGRADSTSVQKTQCKNSTTTNSNSQADSRQTSESSTTGKTHGGSEASSTSRAETYELRQENVVYMSELTRFPDPAKTRRLRSINHVPGVGTWQSEVSLDRMIEHLEKALHPWPPSSNGETTSESVEQSHARLRISSSLA